MQNQNNVQRGTVNYIITHPKSPHKTQCDKGKCKESGGSVGDSGGDSGGGDHHDGSSNHHGSSGHHHKHHHGKGGDDGNSLYK